MTRLYRPRARLRFFVPVPGEDEPFLLDITPSRLRLELNDHNHADKLSVDVDWIDTGVDPRWIAGGTAELYIGSADDAGNWTPDESSLRFVGRLVKPTRRAASDRLSVELEFHDYTSFFLLAKPFASAGIPLYSEDLREAWARICSEVIGVEQLADNLELRGIDSPPLIGSAVAQRFRGLGAVAVKPGIDAWAVWQQCVGMMGLISYFELDRCVVTTATDYYSAVDTPRFIWGKNILEFSESRNNDRALRGVGITSFDPLSGQTIEAIYDPLNGKRKPRKPAAKRPKKPQPLINAEEIDFFQYPGITDPDKLQDLARRVYEERSRQELEGSLKTVDMSVGGNKSDASEIDLLALRSGDTIDVRFLDTADAHFVRQFKTTGERTAYLVSRGYSESVAALIAANADRMTGKSNLFYVKGVSIELESNRDGGSFSVDIQYVNKIDPGGGAAPETGASPGTAAP